MSGGVRDSLAGVLAEHLIGYERRAYPSYVCRCGWDGAQGDDGGPNDGSNDNQDAALAHVAEQLERVVAEARAEALREAAEEADRVERVGLTPANEIGPDEREWFDEHPLRNVDGFQRHRPVVAAWLRGRAALGRQAGGGE